MLRLLRIRNLAVIESIEVEFHPGFTVLTGETGAGKSILVEAVGLLLGARASAELVRTGESLAWIEALFDDADGTELVVRREISSQGRSRSFVNGALATSATLRELSQRLVELHGQHEHQALLDAATHVPLLDDYAGLGESAGTVAAAWATVLELREQLDRSSMDRREREARLELIDFQLREIGKAAPKPDEDIELATVRQVLASAERIQRLCAESYEALYDGERAALGTLAAVQKRLTELAAIEPAFASYLETGASIKSELEDLASFIRDYGQRIDASPERLQQVEDRLAALERLKRRHGPTLSDVIEKGASLARERDLLANAEERSEDVRRRLADAEREYLHHARHLSKARRAAASRFAGELAPLLATLAMAQTRFEVRFNESDLPAESWTAQGIDRAEYFISPNPGEDLRPLSRIVSGGELSRVMLALKTLGARRSLGRPSSPAGLRDSPRTLVFDEVDAGIGGQVADVVGARLQDLGADFQVLCITHLPQIAARAATHLRIAKSVDAGRTVTRVEPLEGESRVDELARMIGGARLSAPARSTARELLVQASGAKAKGESESPPRGESEGGSRRRRG